MVSVNALGQSGWQPTLASAYQAPVPFVPTNPMQHKPFGKEQTAYSQQAEPSQTPTYRQWPWRGFAFASDLGLVGYLVRRPILGTVGWLIALPYYVYALLQPKDAKGREEEAVHQATANGILPFLAAKLSVFSGKWAAKKWAGRLASQMPGRLLGRLTPPAYKAVGGLSALLILTPTVNDPISKWVMKHYQTRHGRV